MTRVRHGLARAALPSALVLLLGFSLGCGGGEPEEFIAGLWGHERDDGTWLVRDVTYGDSSGTQDEYVAIPGEEPAIERTATLVVGHDATLPGGEHADDYLTLYYGVDQDLYPVFDYEILEKIDDKRLTVRAIYTDEPVEYERLDAMP